MNVAQHIAELRRLHKETTAGWFLSEDNPTRILEAEDSSLVAIAPGPHTNTQVQNEMRLIVATRNLLPVLLAAWDLADAYSFLGTHGMDDRLDARRKSYEEALKGAEDA